MPLCFGDINTEYIIKRIVGSDKIRHHLTELGFIVGGKVTIIATISGNLIVNVKETKVAISKELAMKIFI